MKRLYFLFLLIIQIINLDAQDTYIDSIVHRFLFIDNTLTTALMEREDVDKMSKLSSEFNKYFDHKDKKVRVKAIGKYATYVHVKDEKLQQEIAYNTLRGLEDSEYSIRDRISRIMIRQQVKQYATKEYKDRFKKILHNRDQLRNNIILIAGYLGLKGEKDYLYTLLDPASIYLNACDHSYGYFDSTDWVSRLALARLGDERQLDFVLKIMTHHKWKHPIHLVRNLKDDLIYVQQQATTDLLLDLLQENRFELYDNGEVKVSYKQELMPLLQRTISDFPNDYEKTRKWVEKNRFKIKYRAYVFW